MKLVLYPHGGSGNHGCEAIVRSTCKITQADITLFSAVPEEDERVGLDTICNIQSDHCSISRFSPQYIKALFQTKIYGDKTAYDRIHFSPVLKAAKTADYILSIGGDNYCYGVPKFIYLINKEIRKKGGKTILWGCSVEPESIKGEMLEDLLGYTHIIARESITYQAMINKGLKQTVLIPDPAFLLNRIDLPLPKNFIEGNTVGINVSPMIIGHESNKGVTLQNYIELINYIINKTDMQVALIPHVVWSHNDDRIPLNILYDRFKETGRICLIEDHTAEELKGYIARCRFLIAARTHASIAAYSEKIPTLVVGYSVKARGVAQDLFGSYEKYVIPVQSLRGRDDMTIAFKWLQDNESNIKQQLDSIIPIVKEKVSNIGSILKK
ncbi:polysaccharide pyruvyl transferase family protein [Phocaeicola plebeius]|uniref:polysaccharide pyruvyl transferase family protein n=1 Tax=Phocaeicola plebeius TaxID=310297 RepID=UPI0035612A80